MTIAHQDTGHDTIREYVSVHRWPIVEVFQENR